MQATTVSLQYATYSQLAQPELTRLSSSRVGYPNRQERESPSYDSVPANGPLTDHLTTQWLPRKDSGQPPISLLTIWFGANDAAINSPQSVPIPAFKSNLTTLISLVHSPSSPYYSPSTKILLLTPPPVDDTKRNAELASRSPPRPADRDAENTRLYVEAVKEVGREHGVAVVDTWGAINKLAEKEGGLDRFLSDGLHLTGEGYAVVTAAITEAIVAHLPELHWDRLEQIYPHWADGQLGWGSRGRALHSCVRS